MQDVALLWQNNRERGLNYLWTYVKRDWTYVKTMALCFQEFVIQENTFQNDSDKTEQQKSSSSYARVLCVNDAARVLLHVGSVML